MVAGGWVASNERDACLVEKADAMLAQWDGGSAMPPDAYAGALS